MNSVLYFLDVKDQLHYFKTSNSTVEPQRVPRGHDVRKFIPYSHNICFMLKNNGSILVSDVHDGICHTHEVILPPNLMVQNFYLLSVRYPGQIFLLYDWNGNPLYSIPIFDTHDHFILRIAMLTSRSTMSLLDISRIRDIVTSTYGHNYVMTADGNLYWLMLNIQYDKEGFTITYQEQLIDIFMASHVSVVSNRHGDIVTNYVFVLTPNRDLYLVKFHVDLRQGGTSRDKPSLVMERVSQIHSDTFIRGNVKSERLIVIQDDNLMFLNQPQFIADQQKSLRGFHSFYDHHGSSFIIEQVTPYLYHYCGVGTVTKSDEFSLTTKTPIRSPHNFKHVKKANP